MKFIEALEKIEDWLDKNSGEDIEMSEWDYADENTKEYWNLLYNSDPAAFSREQIAVIEDAFYYNYSIGLDDNGNAVSPRIRTVNLMHPQYSPDLLKTMSEAMKLGINLKTCTIKPHRWRAAIFGAMNYGFQKNINIIENSNNYIYPELIGIIDAKEKGINLMKFITKHQYTDVITGDSAFKLMQSGSLAEKPCLRQVNLLNKGDFYALYELKNLTDYITLGGDPHEFINKFCRNQHLYHMAYRNKNKQIITNETDVNEKKENMAQFVKSFGLKQLKEHNFNKTNKSFSVNQKVNLNINVPKENQVKENGQSKEKENNVKSENMILLEDLSKDNFVEDDSKEEEDAIKAAEAEIMTYYR